MGLQRRKANQLSEAEAKATQELAAERQQSSKQQLQRRQQQPQSPLVSYLITVVLGCVFWVVVQKLFKHAMHLA